MRKYILDCNVIFSDEYHESPEGWMETIQFDAEDELHAINQALDYYRCTSLKIICIEKIEKSS